MYLSRLGFLENYFILKSLLFTKFLYLNSYEFPKLKKLKIIFPLYELTEITKSKLIIIILNFLENLTGCKAKINNVKILLKKGLFFKCQVILTKFNYFKFLTFFNKFLLTNSLLKFTTKKIQLVKLSLFQINLILNDIEFFFDAYTRRFLPNSKFFWLEFEFTFSKTINLIIKNNLEFYTQLFFCHNIFEWS